jgi:hypothetical protein
MKFTYGMKYSNITLNGFVYNIYKQIMNFNPLTPELNPSAQRCLTKFFTGDFAS